MKNKFLKLLSIVPVLFQVTPVLANRAYVHEINRVREIEQEFVTEANQQLDALNEYYLAWFELNTELSKLKVDLTPDKSATDLDKANAVKIFGREVLFQISQTRHKLVLFENRFSKLLRTLTSLETQHIQKWDEIVSSLDSLESLVSKRVEEATKYTEKWLEWQYAIFIENRNAFSKNNISELQWYNGFLEIDSLVKKTYEMANYTWNFGNRNDLEAYSAALTLLSVAIPKFFEGSLTSESRLENIKNLVTQIEEYKSRVDELVSKHRSTQISIQIPDTSALRKAVSANQSSTSRNSYGLDSPPAPDDTSVYEDKITKNSKDEYCRTFNDDEKQLSEVVPDPEFPSTWTDDGKSPKSVQRNKIEWRNKPDGSKEWTQTQEKGSIVYGDGVRTSVKICLERTVTEGTRTNKHDPKSDGTKFEDEIESFKSDADRGLRNSQDRNEQAELNQLINELDRLAYKNKLFKDELNKTSNNLNNETAKAAREARESLNAFSDTKNLPKEIPNFSDKDKLNDEENNLKKELLDAMLGMPPVIGNAYNAASFITSLVNNTTPIGLPTTNLDTVIYGAGVLVPLATKIPGVKAGVSAGVKGAKFLGKIAAAAPGAIKIASVFKALKGYVITHAHGLVQILEEAASKSAKGVAEAMVGLSGVVDITKTPIDEMEKRIGNMRKKLGRDYTPSFKPEGVGAVAKVGNEPIKVYRLDKKYPSRSMFSSFEKPPASRQDRKDYLARHGVDPNEVDDYIHLLEAELASGTELFIGIVGKTETASGGSIQVIVEAADWKPSKL